MAQHDYVIANGTGAAVRSDLNNALAAIVSQNSGATAPSTTYAYQWWADTTTGLLKLRNAANNAWITLFQLDGEWSTIALENGTAGAPSIYFKDSGTDTGIYSPGTDQVAISTGGTGRLFVDSSGRVGLGTSTPQELLDIYGTGNTAVRISGSSGGGGDVSQIDFFRIGSNVTSSIKAIRDGGNTSGALTFLTASSGTNAERMRLDASGRLGIGTATVDERLHIVGNFKGVDSSGRGLQIINGATPYIQSLGTSNINDLQILAQTIQFGTGTTYSTSERARIDSSGRLLVGTSTARSNFLNTTLSSAIQVEGASHNTSGISVVRNESGEPAHLTLAASRGTTVGSNTVVQNNDIVGSFSFQGNDGSEFVELAAIKAAVDGTPGANDMPGRLVFSTTADGASSPTERLRIASDGVVFQYTNQYNFSSSLSTIEFVNRNSGGAKTFQWYVGASGAAPVATLSTAGVWTNASDVKNKENIEDIAYGIETLKQLRPRQYDVKSDGSHNIGFVAQEVQPLIPEIVNETVISTTGESHLGLAYGSLTAVLTKALQEAIAKIETLEAKVAALEAS